MSEKPGFDEKYYEDQIRLHKEQEFLENKASKLANESEENRLGPAELRSNAKLTEDLRRARTREHLGIQGDEDTQVRDKFLKDNFSPDGGLSSEGKVNQFDDWRENDPESTWDEGDEEEQEFSE